MLMSTQDARRTALVTGSEGGVGRAITTALASAGYRVVATDLATPPGSGPSDARIEEFIRADLTDEAACDEVVARAVAVTGRLDVLVNNAGVQHVSPIESFPDERWRTIIDLMLTAPFRTSRAAWPHLVASGAGRIINIASVHGLVASPHKAAYVAAKHGLVGLTKVLALEGGACDVTVNAVCPAFVRTPLVDRQVADQSRLNGIPEEEVVQTLMLAPAAVKRLIEPEEVADMVLYLARREAGGITGSTVTIDGGWTAR